MSKKKKKTRGERVPVGKKRVWSVRFAKEDTFGKRGARWGPIPKEGLKKKSNGEGRGG